MAIKKAFKETKLMVLIHKLNEKEFKNLGLWVRSPIHNSSEKVIKLYDTLKKYRKTGKSLESFIVMRNMDILPKGAKRKDISKKNEQDLKQITSLLNRQIEDFLIWKKGKEDTIGSHRLLIDALLEKQLFKLAYIVMNIARKKHQSSTMRNIGYCIDAYKLSEVDYFMDVPLQSKNSAPPLKVVMEALEQSCLSQLMNYYCVVANTKRIIKIGDFPFMEVVKNYVENSNTRQDFTVEIYYRLLKMLEDEQPKDYYTLKAQLYNAFNAFDIKELREFFNYLTNYCYRKIKQGNNEFIQERFEIYKKGIEVKCWSSGTYFSEHQFIHIVKTALSLDELDWLGEFFQTHKDLLNPDVKKDIINYYHALTAFELRQYKEAQKHLRDITANQDFAYYMESKVLLIKIYYDNNEKEYPIDSELENIRKYTSPTADKKMSETVRQQYSNFANFFKRILNRKKKIIYGEALTQANLQALQNDLAKLKPLIERTWLEEKIAELTAALK